jgi:hypothetical protein
VDWRALVNPAGYHIELVSDVNIPGLAVHLCYDVFAAEKRILESELRVIKMVLSEGQVRHGFWAHEPEDNRPPAINYPDEYNSEDHLNLVCTQLDISDDQQGKLVKRWEAILPKLSKVRFLWLNSRVNQALFETACSMTGLEGLYSSGAV